MPLNSYTFSPIAPCTLGTGDAHSANKEGSPEQWKTISTHTISQTPYLKHILLSQTDNSWLLVHLHYIYGIQLVPQALEKIKIQYAL